MLRLAKTISLLKLQSIYISFLFDENHHLKEMQILKPSSCSSGSVAIQLANDMEGRDEPYEAEAHDQYDRRCNLEAWRIVCVEPEHVATTTATPEPSSSAAAAAAARRSSAPQASRGSSAAARRRPRGTASGDYRSGLGLRGASRHGTVWSLRSEREIEGFRVSGNKGRSEKLRDSVILFAIL